VERNLLESGILQGAARLELGPQTFTGYFEIPLVRVRNRNLAGIELLARRSPPHQRLAIIADVENKLLSGFVSQKHPRGEREVYGFPLELPRGGCGGFGQANNSSVWTP